MSPSLDSHDTVDWAGGGGGGGGQGEGGVHDAVVNTLVMPCEHPDVLRKLLRCPCLMASRGPKHKKSTVLLTPCLRQRAF